jgi:hypothetical protein
MEKNMKSFLKNGVATGVLAAALFIATGAMAADDYRGYHDWDHHAGWHHHADNRVYYTGPQGYYEPQGVVYNGAYPVAVPPAEAVYSPYEPGVNLNVDVPIR